MDGRGNSVTNANRTLDASTEPAPLRGSVTVIESGAALFVIKVPYKLLMFLQFFVNSFVKRL